MKALEKRIGRQTVTFAEPPTLAVVSTLAGPQEAAGPLGDLFERTVTDPTWGEPSWERAEARFLEEVARSVMAQAAVTSDEVDYFLAGDLLNQIISASFAARTLGIPYYGLYGACSTFSEAIGLASMLVDGGFASRVIAATASHHLTAERQYRYPTELGVQRKPTASWTATGAGAVMLSRQQTGPVAVRMVTTGKVMDLGIRDPNNMGAAMAPAAAHTLATHLEETGREAGDYDLILSGDLGRLGQTLVRQMMLEDHGVALDERFQDAGILLYGSDQDVHNGGSGAACSALVFCAKVFPQLLRGELRRVLLMATGALHSVTTFQQGETIPGIAQAVVLERRT